MGEDEVAALKAEFCAVMEGAGVNCKRRRKRQEAEWKRTGRCGEVYK